MKRDFRFREIPYNYTSFSDREVILKYFDDEMLQIVDSLREHRVTGRSARLLFDIIGDYFIIDRNPYVYDDLLGNEGKRRRLKESHEARIDIILGGANNNRLVINLVEKLQEEDRKFFSNFEHEKALRRRAGKVLRGLTSGRNIHFSAFHKVAHSTDASDWRVECPFMVVYPDSVEEICKLIPAAKKLGLSIIPRGGGTGLTGGAVPVRKRTLVLNTEKLNGIEGIALVSDNGRDLPVVRVQAGTVTEDVIEFCSRQGYIFATDPTSAWASTIGGNIAENAGGKKCVMWGTAIDNLYSYRIVDARGDLIEVRRREHPYKKIQEEDSLSFDIGRIFNGEFEYSKTIVLSGGDVRKKGLGKDITNKALRGLPGIQKEGGDGIIVSAEFVLYRPFRFCKTVCLEFYGTNLINASRAIVDIRNAFEKNEGAYLTALEHFDEKYILAINYRNKSKRMEVPKAVLLIDIEGNEDRLVQNASGAIVEMVRKYNTDGFIADKDEQRKQFWSDRKNLGAIARHTNAFKLNEDVVIPLNRLPDFAEFIDKMNMHKELSNCIDIIDALSMRIEKIDRAGPADISPEKISTFRQVMDDKKRWYALCLENIDRPATGIIGSDLFMNAKTVFDVLQGGEIRYTIDDVVAYYRKFFHGYDEILAMLDEATERERSRKIIVATHMHAGDGNVHVNIPVHSNDYLMLHEADGTAGAIMEETVRLGGVISGEHGIGLTKLRFIDDAVLSDYSEYKKESDPDDLFNPGKLSRSLPLSIIYTPSFNLLELEAFILKATDLENLSTSVASCVRCGKCKAVCNTHNPGGTMFYNPRNKILGVGLVTEAVLYDAQTSKTLSLSDFSKLRDISNHCTMCHRCKGPCPVKIDFGNTTLAMRNLLVSRKMTRSPLITRFALFYLSRKGYYSNLLLKTVLFKMGYGTQRLAHAVMKPFRNLQIAGRTKVLAMLAAPLPVAGSGTIREKLGLADSNRFYVFENPGMAVRKSVLYFPGCGSERMFPDISYAVIALLYHHGVRVVLPPEYLCCGYPMLANGKQDIADLKSYENRVVLHRISDTVRYMDIKDVIVSCGTCFEMLEKYDMENIFSGARVCDIHEFLVDENIPAVTGPVSGTLFYHEPCHSPLRIHGAKKVFNALFNADHELIPNCCGEGGTMALSTPAIANALRERKIINITECTEAPSGSILTTCPSCVQGLSKIRGELPVIGKHLSVYAAEMMLGRGWKQKFIHEIKLRKAVERVLY
jgi:FAD/FMN-containing dehydrogenase/Fe-S oxidoreductase